MKRKPILIVTGLILVAFGVGMRLGTRLGSKAVVNKEIPVPAYASAPDESASAVAAPNVPASAPEGNPPACVDMRDAGTLVGKRGCVSALIQRVYTARTGNTFLDFCQDYRTCAFSSVIFAADKNKFGDLESLQGKRVEIRGDVVTYQGRAEIVVHDPGQVRQ